MKLSLAVALSFAIVACSSSTSAQEPCRQWAIAPEFTPTEAEDIKHGAQLWNDAIGAQVITFGPSDCSVAFHETDPQLAGYTTAQEILLVRQNIYSRDCRVQIAAHEFGHSLGFRHVPGPAIMTSPSDCIPVVREGDMEECRHAGLCK